MSHPTSPKSKIFQLLGKNTHIKPPSTGIINHMTASSIANKYFTNTSLCEIKILEKSDWQSWKKLRLECLKNAPTAFVSSFEEVSKKSDAFFQEKIEESKIYGAFSGGELISVVCFT